MNEAMTQLSKASRYDKFLELLAETGHVVRSCELAGVSRTHAYRMRNSDPDFAALWDEALTLAVGTIEDEAHRRAVHGVDTPVYYKGEECGSVRKYSDTLLMFLLKAHKPEKYRERYNVNVKGDVSLAGMLEAARGRVAVARGAIEALD